MSVAPVRVRKRQSQRTPRLKPQRARRAHLGRHVEMLQKLETAWNCSPARAERCDRRGGHGQTPQEWGDSDPASNRYVILIFIANLGCTGPRGKHPQRPQCGRKLGSIEEASGRRLAGELITPSPSSETDSGTDRRVVLPGVNARAEVQTCSSPSSGEGRREATADGSRPMRCILIVVNRSRMH